MRKALIVAAIAAATLTSGAYAQLPVGARAPQFTTTGALAGKPYAFDLAKALRKGPVVLYFYPKAFTQGCTLEAHAFAEATGEFAALGAQVIGMSADDLPTLEKFSTAECRDKFAVATATPAIIKAYDVALNHPGIPSGLTDRTSYVIAQDGTIKLVHTEMDYKDHVKLTLDAVRALKKS